MDANATIEVPFVQLPQDFSVSKREQEGKVEFEFNPPVELPYDEGLFEQIRELKSGQRVYSDLRLDYVEVLIKAVLRATLPDYIKEDEEGFYNCSSISKHDFSEDITVDYWNDIELFDYIEKTAWLEVTAHSDAHFPFNIEAETPTIDKVTIAGYVNAGMKIKFQNGWEGFISNEENVKRCMEKEYTEKFSAPIIIALIYRRDLTLEQDPVIREYIGRDYPSVGVQVLNPTSERIRQATKRAKEITEFCEQNNAVLEEILHAVIQLYKIDYHRTGIQRDFDRFLKDYVEKKERLELESVTGLSLPDAEASIDGIINPVDTFFASRLKEVNERLSALWPSFPKGLLEYATPEGFKPIKRDWDWYSWSTLFKKAPYCEVTFEPFKG